MTGVQTCALPISLGVLGTVRPSPCYPPKTPKSLKNGAAVGILDHKHIWHGAGGASAPQVLSAARPPVSHLSQPHRPDAWPTGRGDRPSPLTCLRLASPIVPPVSDPVPRHHDMAWEGANVICDHKLCLSNFHLTQLRFFKVSIHPKITQRNHSHHW